MAGDKLTSHDLYGDDSRMVLLDKQLKGINAELDSVVKKASAMNTALRATPSSTPAGQKKIAAAASDTEKLIQAEQRLLNLRSNTARQMAAISVETAKVRRENILAAKSAQAVKGSYDDLSAQLSIVTIKWRSLTKAERETTDQGKALSAQRKSLIEQLKALDASQGVYSRNVGNYRSAIGGLIGSLKQLVGTYISIQAARAGFDTLFNETKALDTLDKSYKQILRTEQEVSDSKAFLNDISERYGSNLISLSKSYLRFKVAADAGNLSAQQTEDIFNKVSKAASFIGLSVDDTEGAFRALEQIMSKGTVQSEELRGQLGDRLPGAFIIMAESLGVTTQKLGEMLKAGEVLSVDALPKFANQLEKTFNLQTVDRVDNLAAAQGRFNREITLLVESIDAGGAFTSFFDSLSKGLQFIRSNIGTILSLVKVIGLLTAAWVTGKVAQIAYTGAMRILGAQTIAQTIQMRGLSVATKLVGSAMIALETAVKANPLGVVLAAATLLLPLLLKTDKATAALKETVDSLNSSYFDETKTVNDNIKIIIAHDSTMRERQKAYDDLVAKYPDILKNYSLEQIQLGGVIALQKELTNAIVDRIATEKKAQAEKTLFEKTQEANAFVPSTFSTENVVIGAGRTLGVDDADIADARKKRSDEAIKQYEAEVKAIEETAQALKKLNVIKVDSGGPKGRSFGASAFLTPNGDGVDSLGVSTTTKATKDIDKNLLDSLQRRRELNALEQDERKKDIEDLQIFFDEKKALFELNGLDIIRLQEYYNQKLAEINDKYRRDNKVTEPLKPLEVKPLVRSNKSVQDQLLAEFKLQQEIAELRFNAEEHSSEEIQKFKLRQEIELYRKLLEIQKNGGEILSAEEIKRYEALIPELLAIYGDIKPPSQGEAPTDLFSLFNINISDENKQAISDAFAFAKEQAASYFETLKELSDQEVDRANNRVAEAQRSLQYEMDARRDGYADKVETVQKELALAKKAQEQALKQRQKVQKQELILNSILEASNLGVAVAKTLSSGGFYAIPLVAIMLGAFAAAKIKAFQLVNKKTFAKGDVIDVKGGSHASGNDTPLGMSFNSKPGFVERGEKVGIVNKKAVRKYGSSVNDIFNAMNRMQLDQYLNMNRRTAEDMPLIVNASSSFDSSRMESDLSRIRRQGEARETIEGDYRVVRKGNHTTRYRIK